MSNHGPGIPIPKDPPPTDYFNYEDNSEENAKGGSDDDD